MTRIQQAKFLMEQMVIVFEADVNTRHPISEYLDLNTFPSLSNHERESIANGESLPTEKQLDALQGDAMLLSMSARQNAVLGLKENGFDTEHPDNADLILTNWIDSIITSLAFEDHSAELIKTFADIGITA